MKTYVCALHDFEKAGDSGCVPLCAPLLLTVAEWPWHHLGGPRCRLKQRVERESIGDDISAFHDLVNFVRLMEAPSPGQSCSGARLQPRPKPET